MNRRAFIGLIGPALVVLPHGVVAQSASKRPLVAVLSGASSITATRYLNGFPQGLQELGYADGRNIDIAYRYADGIMERMAALAHDIVGLRPDVIVVGNTPAALAVLHVTTTVPIVAAGLAGADEF